MTKDEFNAWKQETDRSKRRWIADLIHDGCNGRDLLVFKGGESGTYIQVDTTGKVTIGKYEMAIPHIGDALFEVTGTQQCKDLTDGITRVLNAIGQRSLLLEVVAGIRS